jgi:hypothetical protein
MTEKEKTIKNFQELLTILCDLVPHFAVYLKDPELAYDIQYNSDNYLDKEEWEYFAETDSIRRMMDEAVKIMGTGYYLDHGAYRYVIVPSDLPYVLKFSRNSYGSGDCPFETEDCCEMEEMIYESACDKGVSNFFAETFPMKFAYDGYQYSNFYLMKKYKVNQWRYPTDEEYEKDSSYYDTIDGYDEISDCFDDDCLGLEFYENYSDEELQCLLDFFYEFAMCDFHRGNIGYDDDGRPVIIDYAFFR